MRRLAYLAGWFFAAISTLGKGPAGFGLPVLVTLAYLAASRPGEDILARLLRIVREIVEFEIVAGLLIVLAVALPWYVAMYVRHGPPFTDRLIFHDMFNRAFSHVHDTNEGDDTSFRFYVWQLGYALFPWTGLAPLGLLWWLRRKDDDRADMSVLLCMWVVLAFALFSFMGTKFHHYIFPAVPPIAILIGVVLDDMLGPRPLARRGSLPLYLGGPRRGPALMVLGVTRMLPGSFLGVKPDGHLADPSCALGQRAARGRVAVTVRRSSCAGFAAPAQPPESTTRRRARRRCRRAGARTRRGCSRRAPSRAALLARRGRARPHYQARGRGPAGRDPALQLFTYNYRRGWPESLDFSAVLAGFTVVAIVASRSRSRCRPSAGTRSPRCARSRSSGASGASTCTCSGRRSTGASTRSSRRTTRTAQSPAEQLVAYQMNWKGENFYTGNHVPAFVSTGLDVHDVAEEAEGCRGGRSCTSSPSTAASAA